MAANILKEMRAAGHALDTCTLNHALSVLTLAQRTRQAFEFYDAMFNSEGAPADVHTYLAMLRLCNATRLLQKAELVFADMRASAGVGAAPPFEAYVIMLRLFAEFKDRAGAAPYLAEMEALGYELRSRSLKLSIPTFFTMSDEDRCAYFFAVCLVCICLGSILTPYCRYLVFVLLSAPDQLPREYSRRDAVASRHAAVPDCAALSHVSVQLGPQIRAARRVARRRRRRYSVTCTERGRSSGAARSGR
jgi:hypothetical protein